MQVQAVESGAVDGGEARMKIIAVTFALILTGCTGVKTITADMQPVLGGCRTVEARPSWMSTQSVTVCWSADGEVIASTGSAGRAVVDVPIAVLDAGAMVAGAVILGGSVVRAAKGMRLDGDVTHRVDLPELPELPELPDDFQIPDRLP